MKTRIFAAAVLSAAVSLAFAASPDAAAPGRNGFQNLDKNGDGSISREEAAASPRLSESFDRIDTNKDGMLSADELRAARASHRGQHPKLDTNGDGLISRDEAKAAPRLAENFDAIDSNKDGQLSRDEMATWHKSHPARRRLRPQRSRSAAYACSENCLERGRAGGFSVPPVPSPPLQPTRAAYNERLSADLVELGRASFRTGRALGLEHRPAAAI